MLNKKVVYLFLGIGLLISLFFNYQYYKEKQRDEYKYHTFINHLYFNIDHSLDLLDNVLNKDNNQQIDEQISRLSKNLLETHLLLKESLFFLEGVSYPITLFQRADNMISHGIDYNGKIIPPFLDDQLIDKYEHAYLVELKNVLNKMHQQLYSEDTGQENPNISKYVFHEMIRSLDHNVLLEKYLDN